MILKLTKVLEEAEDLDSGTTLLVNTDEVAAIHNQKIVRKVPIIGQENTIFGSVITLANGRAFPVKESGDKIYDALPGGIKIDVT